MTLLAQPRLHGLVLDADGTLYTLARSVGTVYAEVLAGFAITANAVAFDRALPFVWAAFEDEYLARGESYRTDSVRERRLWNIFIERMLEQVGIASSPPAVIEALYREFARGDIRILATGVVDFLELLSDLDIVVVVATNNDERVRSVVEQLGIQPYLRHIFWAGDLGWKKPSPNFFSEISKRVGIDGSCLLHVGNNVELDVSAARSAGWDALLFDPQGRGPTPRISSFTELGRIVCERAR